jgi:hypothetical protein
VKESLLTEIRDWLDTAATGIGLYLAWRWRPRNRNPGAGSGGRHYILHLADSVSVSDAVELNLAPSQGRSSATLALTSGNEAGAEATLNSMAELDPDFPQF